METPASSALSDEQEVEEPSVAGQAGTAQSKSRVCGISNISPTCAFATANCGALVSDYLQTYNYASAEEVPCFGSGATWLSPASKESGTATIALRILSCDLDKGTLHGFIKEHTMTHEVTGVIHATETSTFSLNIHKGTAISAGNCAYELRVDLSPLTRFLRRASSASPAVRTQTERSSSQPPICGRPLVRRNTMSPSVYNKSYAEVVKEATTEDATSDQKARFRGKECQIPLNIDIAVANETVVDYNPEFEEEFPVPTSPPASPRATFRKLINANRPAAHYISPPAFTKFGARRLSMTKQHMYDGIFATAQIFGNALLEDGSRGANVKLSYNGHMTRGDWDNLMTTKSNIDQRKMPSDMSASYTIV